MSLVYLDPSNLPALEESTRQAINQLRNAIEQRTILPMVHSEQRLKEDGSLNIVPALVDPMTTANVEMLLDAVRSVAGKVYQTASNHCRCAERYNALEDAKLNALAQFADAKPSSSKQDKGTAILNARLEEIDKQIAYMFGGKIPPTTAMSAADPPCEFCGKPRFLPEWAAFTEPSFLQNLLKLSLGGEFPLNYLPLLLEAVDNWIYNPDLIPAAKKKRVDEVLKKFKYLDMKDLAIQKIADFLTGGERTRMERQAAMLEDLETLKAENARLTTLIASSNAAPKETPDATATLPAPSDSARPTLTPDFLPESNDSSMSNTSKPAEN